jgi:cytosine deaminase
MTLRLTNALLPDGRRVNISVEQGRIAAVTPVETSGPADATAGAGNLSVEDLGGRLVLPGLVEPHAHIDKALTADNVPNPRGDLIGAIDAWVAAAKRGQFTFDDMVMRARAALERLLLNGTTAVRTHVNVGGGNGVMHLRAVQEAITEFTDLMDIQIVALTASPMTGPDGADNRAALLEAVSLGAHLVGGCPHLDPDPQGLIDNALRVASDAGIGMDLHVDETLDPHMLSLRLLARSILDTGFPHEVSASHCVSLSMVPIEVQQAVAREAAEARIAVIPLPQTNLFLQGWEHESAMPRGIAPINVLRDAGVRVAVGADNVQDPFNPMGRSDALETASLLVMAAHQLPDAALELVGNCGREVLGVGRVDMRVGDPADLVAIAAPTVRGAMADAPRDRIVYRRGRRVAQRSETAAIVR